MFRPLHLAGLMLALCLLAAALLINPSALERVTILERDGMTESALAAGEATSLTDRRMLARLFHLHRTHGDPSRAREIIDQYLAEWPHDIAMQQSAVDFFQEQQDVAALIDSLESLIEHTGSPDDIQKLAAIYRLYGRFAEESSLLLRFAANAELPAETRLRVAELLSHSGEVIPAIAVLEELERSQLLDGSRFRPLLFDLLVKTGQSEPAVRYALEWAADPRMSNSFFPLFALILIESGMEEEGLRLASTLRMPEQDGLAWKFGESGRPDLALSLLADWFDDAHPHLARHATQVYVDIVRATGSMFHALDALHRSLAEDDPASLDRAARLAAILFNEWGYAAIAPFRHLLSAPLLEQEPLFAASLAAEENNVAAERYFLLRSDLSAFDDRQAQDWAQLASSVFTPDEIAVELFAAFDNGRLSPTLRPFLRQVAVAAGHRDPIFELLRESAPTSERSISLLRGG